MMVIDIAGKANAVAKGPWLLGENIWTPPHDLDHEIKSKILGNELLIRYKCLKPRA